MKNKFYEVGKINYSNNKKYIGNFFKLNGYNYKKVSDYMNKILKEWKFEDHKDKFLYSVYEEYEEVNNVTVNKIFVLEIIYSLNHIFTFDLLYTQVNKEIIDPLKIYNYENIFKYKELNKNGTN